MQKSIWCWLKVKLVPITKWKELYECLEKAKKESIEARYDTQTALELAIQTEKEKSELKIKLQEAVLQLDIIKFELANLKDKAAEKNKQKILIVGGSPGRKETINKIGEKWDYLDIEWLPSEKTNGKSKSWSRSLDKKVGSADLLLIVQDYIGHPKQESALKACRSNNGQYKIIPTLSCKALESALDNYAYIK